MTSKTKGIGKKRLGYSTKQIHWSFNSFAVAIHEKYLRSFVSFLPLEERPSCINHLFAYWRFIGNIDKERTYLSSYLIEVTYERALYAILAAGWWLSCFSSQIGLRISKNGQMRKKTRVESRRWTKRWRVRVGVLWVMKRSTAMPFSSAGQISSGVIRKNSFASKRTVCQRFQRKQGIVL